MAQIWLAGLGVHRSFRLWYCGSGYVFSDIYICMYVCTYADFYYIYGLCSANWNNFFQIPQNPLWTYICIPAAGTQFIYRHRFP